MCIQTFKLLLNFLRMLNILLLRPENANLYAFYRAKATDFTYFFTKICKKKTERESSTYPES